MHKLSIALLVTAIALSLALPVFASEDVSDELETASQYLSSHGIMVGDGEGNMNFSAPLTRAHLATILSRIHGGPTQVEDNQEFYIAQCKFLDVAPVFARAIEHIHGATSIADLFFGNVGGCLGETSALLLLIGFGYLLYRNVITARIPLSYMGTVAVLAFLFPLGNDRIAWTAAQLFGGGLMLGAIFMATDYVTSPVTKLGQIVYGIGCGVLTILIRYFGGYNEGVSYAILVMNCCVVLLDRIGRPVKFGAPKKEAAK